MSAWLSTFRAFPSLAFTLCLSGWSPQLISSPTLGACGQTGSPLSAQRDWLRRVGVATRWALVRELPLPPRNCLARLDTILWRQARGKSGVPKSRAIAKFSDSAYERLPDCLLWSARVSRCLALPRRRPHASDLMVIVRRDEQQEHEPSWWNKIEAQKVVDLCKKLLAEHPDVRCPALLLPHHILTPPLPS